MKVYFLTHGCKANQYDTEAFRQELEARGARAVDSAEQADVCVINTCTVTNNADAAARKAIRKVKRDNPSIEVLVAGCSASLRADDYDAMSEVSTVVPGQNATEIADALIAPESPLLHRHEEAIGAELLEENRTRTRGWLKIQDGCDRRCSFCATRIARGVSRSRDPIEIVAEAQLLAQTHRELVLTGIHIGHYGKDLNARSGPKAHSLSSLVRALIENVDSTRFRLGSIEATEIDDDLVDLLANSGGRLVPHLHVPMQSGSNAVLRSMRRWHTREQYRDRIEEIASKVDYLGLGADIIVGFPGESDQDHADTRELVETLPYTYLHVFPYSERDGTAAAERDDQVDHAIKTERSRELRELGTLKGQRYRQSRHGQGAEIVVEDNGVGLTEDYLRVDLSGPPAQGDLVYAPLKWQNDRLVATLR